MANFEAMDREIDELADEIGLDVARLQQLLPKDDQYIAKLVSLGRSQEFAERASFIGDLRNVVGLMASHNFSAHTAARMIRQTPENPVEISTTEDEEDEDEEQQQPQQQGSSQDEISVYPGSSESSCRDSQSISSSEDEPAVEAKRLKLDPDYLPSDDTSVESTPETTAANSQLPSEEESEEEEETTESEEDETFVPNDTSEEEIEVAEEDEDSL